jgi:hypothetical protein
VRTEKANPGVLGQMAIPVVAQGRKMGSRGGAEALTELQAVQYSLDSQSVLRPSKQLVGLDEERAQESGRGQSRLPCPHSGACYHYGEAVRQTRTAMKAWREHAPVDDKMASSGFQLD